MYSIKEVGSHRERIIECCVFVDVYEHYLRREGERIHAEPSNQSSDMSFRPFNIIFCRFLFMILKDDYTCMHDPDILC